MQKQICNMDLLQDLNDRWDARKYSKSVHEDQDQISKKLKQPISNLVNINLQHTLFSSGYVLSTTMLLGKLRWKSNLFPVWFLWPFSKMMQTFKSTFDAHVWLNLCVMFNFEPGKKSSLKSKPISIFAIWPSAWKIKWNWIKWLYIKLFSLLTDRADKDDHK